MFETKGSVGGASASGATETRLSVLNEFEDGQLQALNFVMVTVPTGRDDLSVDISQPCTQLMRR